MGRNTNSYAAKAAVIAIASALASPISAQAQDTERQAAAASQATTETYTVENFAIYNPLTALEVVRQVPGYTLSTSADLRGLGANVGNLLINGEVPTSKADSIENILSRIPVGSIERLEVRSAQGTTDAASSGRVLNIVLKNDAKMAGTWRSGVLASPNNPAVPFANGSVRGNISQATSYDIGLGALGGINGYDGPEFVTDLVTGNLIERRDYDQFGFQRQYSGNASITTLVAGTSLNVRGKVIENHVRAERDAIITNDDGMQIATGRLVDQSPKDSLRYEIGLDAERSITSLMTGKLTLLYNRDDRLSVADAVTIRPGGTSTRSTRSDTMNDEKVARASVSRVIGKNVLQIGGEIASNRLRSTYEDVAIGNNPADNVQISELRYEPFVSWRMPVAKGLSLDSALLYERSRITLEKPNEDARSYGYLKPRVTLNWEPSAKTSMDFTAERTVTQLNFYDFATNSDLQDSRVITGNLELVPESAWVVRGSVRYNPYQGASIQLRARHEWISDLLDRVPIFDYNEAGDLIGIYDAPGNIGKGRRTRIEANITAPLGPVITALKGFELRYSGAYENTQATDPVTNTKRQISWVQPWAHDLTARYDSPGFGAGGNVVFANYSPVYYFNEFMRLDVGTTANAWVELRKVIPAIIRFDLLNANRALVRRNRTLYLETRNGPEDLGIDRFQKSDITFKITVSGRF